MLLKISFVMQLVRFPLKRAGVNFFLTFSEKKNFPTFVVCKSHTRDTYYLNDNQHTRKKNIQRNAFNAENISNRVNNNNVCNQAN